MPATPNAAGAFPLVFLVFFLIPAAWIAGVVYLGSRPRRIALWSLPFIAFYSYLFVTEQVLPNRAIEYELAIEALGPDNYPFKGGVDYLIGASSGHDNFDLDGKIRLPARHTDPIVLRFLTRQAIEVGSLRVSAADVHRKHHIEATQRLQLLPISEPSSTLPWRRELTIRVQARPK